MIIRLLPSIYALILILREYFGVGVGVGVGVSIGVGVGVGVGVDIRGGVLAPHADIPNRDSSRKIW